MTQNLKISTICHFFLHFFAFFDLISIFLQIEPRRRKFHKPITLCIPLPASGNKAMLTQYSGQTGAEPPTLRLLW